MKYNATIGYDTCPKHGNYHASQVKRKDSTHVINSTCPECRSENPNNNRIKQETLK